MFTPIKVIRFNNVGSSRSEKPLVATGRSQIFVVARILGDFDAPHTVGHGSHAHGILTKSKVQIVACIRDIKVDVESGVGTANDGYGILVRDGKSIGQATGSVGYCFSASSRHLLTIEDGAHGGGISGRSSDGKGQKVQTDLADIFGAFAEAGTATACYSVVAGALEVGAVFRDR